MTKHNGSSQPLSESPGVPLVVQLGFAGSRVLLDSTAYTEEALRGFEDALELRLRDRLRALVRDLNLTERHFFCGLSQLAIGADTIFTRALQTLNWPQRFLLPQNREDFLAAKGSNGLPDFNETQQEVARKLFESPHAIEQHVASHSANRHTRFQDVNRELVHLSDVLVCLVGGMEQDRTGGTRELIEAATLRGTPVLELHVEIDPDGTPRLRDQWHHKEAFVPPSLPHELAELQSKLAGIPSMRDYCQPLKSFASRVSKGKQRVFRLTALVVIGAHLLATCCAVAALQKYGTGWLSFLLGAELLLLATGLIAHQHLHGSHMVRVWAMTRLVAEAARSALALENVEGYLEHLFNLPLPESLRPMLQTLNVLHLRGTCSLPNDSWQERRDRYLKERLEDSKSGQIAYYEGTLARARVWQRTAGFTFLSCSILAIASSLGELALSFHLVPLTAEEHERYGPVLSTLAIVLPVLAVGALSLAASFDFEARTHTYSEMVRFLEQKSNHIRRATSEPAFHALALQTEQQLLGETASWYARRAFINVT